jgi:6-pyruvoyltetrahydropterin/6-carboxytetrahydropterin synthase
MLLVTSFLKGDYMYEINIIKSFSAAHMITNIGGKCEDLHGHNFKIEVTVASTNLNADGILIDFRVIKRWLNEILDNLDHQNLNDVPFFTRTNPSSENIAQYISEEMKLKAAQAKVKVARIKVWESENAAVTYIAD